MRCLVTGAAGFVGSHLSERLIALGHDVVGVDRFSDYYPRHYKDANIARLLENSRFRLMEHDLVSCDIGALFDGCEIVFHQAAQAGVRASWGKTFESYVQDNVLATQRILEAARGHATVRKVVYASSSSVYGDTLDLPMRESGATHPHSPYGVTKLAAEHLCELYRRNFGLSTASLRYFTVYGPRQRPDMAFHKFIEATLDGRSIPMFGDGLQTRDFTFIADIVEANVNVGLGNAEGVFNIGGGSRVTLREVLGIINDLAGTVILDQRPNEAGDVTHTWADTSAAQKAFGYSPKVSLREGLAQQVAWHESRRS